MSINSMETEIDIEASAPKAVVVEEKEAEIEAQPVPLTFPEGGLHAWLTLLGTVLIQYSTFGYTIAYGAFQDFYVREYLTKYSPSAIGWIGGTQIFLVFSSGIVVGRLFDRGYFHHLMIGGCLIHAFSFFMLSLTKENQFYQVFLSHGVGIGLASGLTYVPSLGIVSHYFQKKRALAMGVVAAGTALGATLHPIMVNQLVYSSIGFHGAIRIISGMNCVLFVIANLIMRPRLPPRKNAPRIAVSSYFKEPTYTFMVVGGMFVLAGLFFPSFYIQLAAIRKGVDENTAFYLLSALNAASIFGRTIPPLYAPKLGVTNLNIASTFIMGIVGICMLFVSNTAGFIVFAIAYGFVSGSTISLTATMIASVANSVDEVGSRMGISFAFAGLLALFSQPISGALLTTNFIWLNGILFSGITILCSGASLLVARHYLVRHRGTQFV
ncbi:MFS general substrate transporter [Crucibulum laeve]|uniref:MFS general substrate transporter n=1 Tax=Crucibulum laeve TaxID=68775 RepID=A0A5C3LK32_9AGAR|nr:MFS general substrate transporter [Crucibulum laeve]